MDELGETLTRWTVRAAVVGYFAAVSLMLASRQPARRRAATWVFTVGCALFVAHVALAFHFFHHWSHAHAYEETARQTEELTGVRTGFGLWLNYQFTLLWIGETIAWWRGPCRGPVRFAVHLFMLFIIFNATVVFETGAVRWGGALGCVVVLVLAFHRWRMDRSMGVSPVGPSCASRSDGKSQ